MPDLDTTLREAIANGLLWRFADIDAANEILAITPTQRTPEQHALLTTIAAQLTQTHYKPDKLGAYLTILAQDCQHLTLDQAAPSERAMSLEQIYIELETNPLQRESAEQRSPNQERQERTISMLEAVSQQPTVVILGDPGGGKSSFVKHIALLMTQLLAGRRTGHKPKSLREQGWCYARPHVPIRLELRRFAEWLSTHPNQHASMALWCYVEALYTEKGLANAAEVRELLNQMYVNYGALLLLDGLDEVPSGPILDRVLSTIQALAATRRADVPSHIVVTCRSRDYAEDPQRQLAAWPTSTILPLSPDLQTRFVQAWYATLHALERLRDRDFEQLSQQLIQQIANRPELERMAPNPLLLTMMAQVHSTKHLPDSRVALYEECVDQLLLRWRDKDAHKALPSLLKLPEWNNNQTKDLLKYLGYAAHLNAPQDDKTSVADVSESLFRTVAEGYFERFAMTEYCGASARTEFFLNFVSDNSNGLLQKVGPRSFAFPHRTFQEYFAALRLIAQQDWPEELEELSDRVAAVIDAPHWRETLKLAINAMKQQDRSRDAAEAIDEVLEGCDPLTDQGAYRAAVLGELVLELGLDTVIGMRKYKHLPQTLIADYYLPLLSEPAQNLSIHTRFQASLVLGQLGDPRPCVTDWQPEWVEVSAGPFVYGSSDADQQAFDWEKPQRTLELPTYYIAKYPTTNAQFRHFIDAGGYSTERWWTPAGWRACQQRKWKEPRLWDDQRFNLPNQPVVGVSWYEADAYCAWLSAQLGQEVRLPSEAEWEKAARGTDGRIYPWGDQWHETYANTNALDWQQTSPVGLFKHGLSPYGCLDMAGNVWEWSANVWDDSNSTESILLPNNVVDITDKNTCSMRGGSWDYDPRNVRSAYRDGDAPSNWYYSLGFRALTLCKPNSKT